VVQDLHLHNHRHRSAISHIYGKDGHRIVVDTTD
jgi:hypothetical protein